MFREKKRKDKEIKKRNIEVKLRWVVALLPSGIIPND